MPSCIFLMTIGPADHPCGPLRGSGCPLLHLTTDPNTCLSSCPHWDGPHWHFASAQHGSLTSPPCRGTGHRGCGKFQRCGTELRSRRRLRHRTDEDDGRCKMLSRGHVTSVAVGLKKKLNMHVERRLSRCHTGINWLIYFLLMERFKGQ